MTGPGPWAPEAAPGEVALVARAAAHLRGAGRRDGAVLEESAVHDAVREVCGVMGHEDRERLVAAVRAELTGAGPLQPLLELPEVSDVLVNGPRSVWVDRGDGLERTSVDLGDVAAVRALAVRLAAAGGQRLDDAAPVVDARLPDGTRVHAVLPPVAADGAVISLRVHARRRFTLDGLVASGGVAPEIAPVLAALVARRANLLVSGATGTGKTTLLAALLAEVPASQRVVCIEESGELDPDHPHVVRLVARRANVEGAGSVDLAELVRQALRMRPDRIVLGECRGAEVREVLTAMNTGHDGGLTTLHANTVEDVPARLEALGALAGMGREALAAQALSAVDAVVHLRRDGRWRRVAQVGEVRRVGGSLAVAPVLELDRAGRAAALPGWTAFCERWRAGR